MAGSRTGSGASRTAAIRRRRHPGLAELDRRGGQGGDRLEGGERGQRQHRQRDPGQRAVSGGGDAEQQDAPQGQPGDRRTQARAAGRTPPRSGRPAWSGPRRPRSPRPARRPGRRRRAARPRPPAGRLNVGGQLAPGRRQAPARRRAPRMAANDRDADPGGQQPGGEHGPGGRQDQQAGDDRAGADQRGGQRRGDAPDEQVLRRVDVGDQPGEQVTGGERGQPGRGQPFQPPVDADPDVGQDPERGVVRRPGARDSGRRPRPALSARTATTAAEIARMLGCCDARASRNPETASSATPQPVAAAPAATASSSRPRSGRASPSSRSSGSRRDRARRSWRHRQPGPLVRCLGPDRPDGRARPWSSSQDPGGAWPTCAGGRWVTRTTVRSAIWVSIGGHDPVRAGRVEMGGGLVEQQHRGAAQERPGQGDLLPLPGRQVAGALGQDGVVAVVAAAG